MGQFESLCELNETKNFIREKKFQLPTAIQELALDELKKDGNYEIFSPTGSGKTLAYLLPLCEKFKKLEQKNSNNKTKGASIVVMAPTRELAAQIARDARELSHHLKFRVRKIDGPKDGEIVMKTGVDLLVGVPGNISLAVKKGKLNLSTVWAFVIDEADQMLIGGFNRDLEEIKKNISPKAQTILISATEGEEHDKARVSLFGKKEFNKIAVSVNHLSPQIETFNIFVSVKEKIPMAKEFLKKEAKGEGIIFLNKKEEIEGVFNELQGQFPNKKMVFIHGGMTPKERDRAYQSFLDEGEILISSDIMARGIDVKKVSWVLNYDLPFEAIYYIHRSGRVGRGGKSGQVYNLVTSQDSDIISRINESIRNQSALRLSTIKDPYKAQKLRNQEQSAKDKKIELKTNRRAGSKGSFKSTPRYARKKNKKSKKG